MNIPRLSLLPALLLSTACLAGTRGTPGPRSPAMLANGPQATIAGVVRATQKYRDPEVAEADGYQQMWACVNAEGAGAMGIHFVNSALLGDGEVNAGQPEALVYEPTIVNGTKQLQLVAVEYVTFADAWDANHPGVPPVLLGQSFDYVATPNRFELPATYNLHVWAFKHNPNGMFSDWNPDVSCLAAAR